jgi:hypothetical protein
VGRIAAVLAAAGAAVLAVFAIWALGWYVVEALIGRRGQPDQSLQFWGLAIVFLGIFAGLGAVGLGYLSFRLFTR